MKRIACLLFAVFFSLQSAYADTCSASLTGPFVPAQATALCSKFGTGTFILNNNVGLQARLASGTPIPIIKIDAGDDTNVLSDSGDPIELFPQSDANRIVTVNAASDTAHTITFGDGGTTAAQTLFLGASTVDGDDDSAVCDGGGGAAATGRGGYVCRYGQEHATKAGAVELVTTGGADGRIIIDASSGGAISLRNGGTVQWLSDATSFRNDATNGVPIVFQKAGTNVQLASYVPTMAATPVVGTNMIQPGLNVIPTAAANTAAIIGPSTPVPGQQFDITNSGPNSVRIKAGGGATLNGATAGGYLVLATLNKARCVTQSATNYDCELEVLPTPAGP